MLATHRLKIFITSIVLVVVVVACKTRGGSGLSAREDVVSTTENSDGTITVFCKGSFTQTYKTKAEYTGSLDDNSICELQLAKSRVGARAAAGLNSFGVKPADVQKLAPKPDCVDSECIQPYKTMYDTNCIKDPKICEAGLAITCQDDPMLCSKTTQILNDPTKFEKKYGACEECYAPLMVAAAYVATAMYIAATGDQLPPDVQGPIETPNLPITIPPKNPGTIDPREKALDF